MFDVPVVLFIFKRQEKTLQILDRIASIKPTKLYLISDGPRNEQESLAVHQCRKNVEMRIDWPCNVIKNYSEENRGVYDRIGLGAKWVLGLERFAIFLEDDNLPELSFFPFCKDLLEKYEWDNRVLWICGTNYLESYQPMDGSSYVFTKHMLPCGWASWSSKFLTYYDGEMNLWDNTIVRQKVLSEFTSKALKRQWERSWTRTHDILRKNSRGASWDGQMAFSMRAHGLLAVSPRVNLIENIGVDMDSEHGGNSFSKIMTKRFCGMRSLAINFPLVHPPVMLVDEAYEAMITNTVLLPLSYRIRGMIVRGVKFALLIKQDVPIRVGVEEKCKNVFKFIHKILR